MSICAEFFNKLSSHLEAPRWLVAYSGGADSTAVLHLAVATAKQLNGPSVTALHINHGLSVNADAWQQHCEEQCRALDVEFIVEQVDVVNSGGGVEQAARSARYSVFEQHLAKGELLLLGHQLDDQAETVLFRLFRGAGVAGLAAIKAERPLGAGRLCRPLLAVARTDIEAYLVAVGLRYIHDESNDANSFDRNYIRNQLLPLISSRWPQAAKTLAVTADHANEAGRLLADLADIDFRATVNQGEQVDLEALARLSDARQKNVLRFWLGQKGVVPTAAQLLQIKQQFVGVKHGSSPQVIIGSWQLNRCHERLYCEPVISPPLEKFEAYEWPIDSPLILAENIKLNAEPVPQGGVLIGGSVALSFERAAKRFQPAGRAHSNTVKKLMQASDILPWHRNLVPLIFVGDDLAAIPGVGVAQTLIAPEGRQGYRICLTMGRHRYLCE